MNPEVPIAGAQEQKPIKSSLSHLIMLFLVILGVAALSALGTYYYLLPQLQNQKINSYPLQQSDQSTIQQNIMQKGSSRTSNITGNQTTNSTNKVVINLNSGIDSLTYFKGQISAPNDYFATDDNMIEPYNTQGGMAPPRLILMKGYQVTADNYWNNIHQSKNDCIVINSTNGENSINDWNSLVGFGFKEILTENEKISVGVRSAQIYTLNKKDGDIYVGFLSIGNKDNTSYYFHSCNANNKTDFINVIQSIKFRDDISR